MHALLLLLAADPAVTVTWTGDARCPSATYEHSLAAYLVDTTLPAPVHTSVTARRDGPRWTLTLTLDDAGHRTTRQLRADSCTSVSEAAAFVTAVIVDPTLVDRTPEPPHVDPPILPEPPAPRIDPPTPVLPEPPTTAIDPSPAPLHHPPPPPSAPRIRGLLRVAGGLEALGAPRIGAQIQLAAGLLGHAWRFELRALYRAPTTAPTGIPETSAKIGLWTTGAHGCGVLHPGPLELPLCAGLEAGQAFGAASGYAGARPARIPWAAATATAALAWAPRPWLALWLAAELAVPLLGGTFGIGPRDIHEVGQVAPRATFGLEFRLPQK